MKYNPELLYGRSATALTAAYLCVAAAFAVAVDLATASAVGSVADWTPAHLVGDLLLVVGSGGLLYGAVTHHRRRAETARRDLETSNQQLQVLSRVFRHNVRNDLNVIQGYTDLLADRIDDERSRECLETIRQTTDDVVDISEKLRVVEDASAEPSDGRVDLVDAVHEAVEVVDADGAAVTVETPSEAWIRADDSVAFPIREVFENAVTHNDGATRRVAATIRENGTTTCLEVTDNGPGIPPEERAVLQAEEETPLSHASSIGLWLVKWMCETQGGTVRFDATDDGTTVRLRFESAATPPTPVR
ncbi:HAMP domain-containing histidine kinase [Halorubrum sp. ASP1]|uniref:histidine kinase n=1 Tax=Halorubrum tropicale TaxID=1765655 RepID=A0A0N0UB08_9EURY|nr:MULTISPECIES: HAMP domain-containing sensor histidine kinase [Halorubrum]KOX97876.1 histidine kinase [Halorubrum tropicale]TKX50503.1 HAMP domain-containing histidine kinase [Halorubrum sp. ASP121]TKX62308.1 HAMP domain-containing histidine kinase [Halorubrum sp. ASP1]